jgi:cytochrome c-type biogenesis protein CcmH
MLFVQFLTPSSFLPLNFQGKDAFGATLEGRIGFLKVKDKGYFKIRNHDKKLSFFKCDCTGWIGQSLFGVACVMVSLGCQRIFPSRKVNMGKGHYRYLSMAICLTGLLVMGFLAVGRAAAQEPTPSDDEVNRIASQLYCPVCENIPLDACPTQACEQWRDLIRQKLSEGWTDEEIKGFFVEQYGDRVLAEPPRRGLNWLIYVLPVVVVLFGVWILWRSFRQAPPVEIEQADAPEDPYLARVERDLAEMDRSS